MLIKDLSIRTAIEQLDPTAGFELTKDNVLLNWNSSVRSQPTDEEIQKKLAELKDAEPMRLLRQERNQKLAETDWMSFSDSPTMTDAWRTYRQALRDLPSTAEPQLDENSQLTNVTWPTKPT